MKASHKALRIKALAPKPPYGNNDETMPILCQIHAFLARPESDL